MDECVRGGRGEELLAIERTIAEALEKCAKFHRLQEEAARVQEDALAAAVSARKGLKYVRAAVGKLSSEDPGALSGVGATKRYLRPSRTSSPL